MLNIASNGNTTQRKSRAWNARSSQRDEDGFRLDIPMDHAAPMRQVEGGSDMFDHRQDFLVRKALLVHALPQVAGAQITHDQVCFARFSPVVEKRNNVRMFQARDQLGFPLKTPNKLAAVSVNRQDRLDGHFAAYGQLSCAINDAGPAFAEPLVQLIPFDYLF